MAQFRKDPFGPAWVIISPERGLEASDFGSALPREDSCLLCPGREEHGMRELRAARPSASGRNSPDWQMRVLESPSALLEERVFEPQGSTLFTSAVGSGHQEIIVEHPEHGRQLDSMSKDHLVALLKLYRERLEFLAAKPGTMHVQLSRNVGAAASAVYEHPHAQLLALPVVSRWVEEERQAGQAYFETEQRCVYCDVIEAELVGRERLLTHNEHFVASAPFASRHPFETWILPRQHSSSFVSASSTQLPDLAELLQNVLRAMNGALNHPPYNMVLHMLPLKGEAAYHWHIELLPRLTSQAGFDWGSGFYVNPTPPEDAVRFLREALALQAVEQ